MASSVPGIDNGNMHRRDFVALEALVFLLQIYQSQGSSNVELLLCTVVSGFQCCHLWNLSFTMSSFSLQWLALEISGEF